MRTLYRDEFGRVHVADGNKTRPADQPAKKKRVPVWAYPGIAACALIVVDVGVRLL